MNSKLIIAKIPTIARIKNPHFRTAYILKPGFRLNALRPYCDNIVFTTDGYQTDIDMIFSQSIQAFQSFDPMLDCIIPVGTALVNLITGYILQDKFPNKSIAFAMYNKEYIDTAKGKVQEDYIFYLIPLGDVIEFYTLQNPLHNT